MAADSTAAGWSAGRRRAAGWSLDRCTVSGLVAGSVGTGRRVAASLHYCHREEEEEEGEEAHCMEREGRMVLAGRTWTLQRVAGQCTSRVEEEEQERTWEGCRTVGATVGSTVSAGLLEERR